MAGIRAKGVYKIFGDRPEAALELLDQGKTKGEVQAETGQVVGVQNVSFELESGSLFVIMGLSGSGKSTLLRCINRLVEPTAGEIVIEAEEGDIEIASLSRKALRRVREKKIAMIFQHFALFPYRTVLSNATFGLEIQGMGKKERSRKGMEILELVGLKEWADSYPDQLSGGMQQRVGLARALASEGEILLMDEPFSALDPLIRVYMQTELVRLQQEIKRTILVVSHDLDEALKLGDRIAIMEDGRIVQAGTPENIIVNPRTEYVAKFVEQADATGVLTARTIAKSVSVTSERPRELQAQKAKAPYFVMDEDLICCMDENHRPVTCFRNGKALKVKGLDSSLDDADLCDVVFCAKEDTSVRELMEARLKSSDNPFIVLSSQGKFRGIITEHEILRGILEKGRTDLEASEGEREGES